MKLVTRQRLAVILTGAVVVMAFVVAAVFLTTGTTAPTAAPTPTAGNRSEILSPTATPTAIRLGTETTPLITEPLPESARATGKLVAGFPTTVISIPPESKVVSSSIATEGVHMQATVIATSTDSEGDVQSYFEGIFTPLELTGTVTPSISGSTATTYSRGTDQIIVTTTADSGGTHFSVFGLFTAGKS